MAEKIGLVGVGLMGHGIALNVLRQGYDLTFLDHPGNQPIDRLVEAGARAVQSLPELAAFSDIIILVVTGAPQVEDIVLSNGGLSAHMKPGSALVDCSTSLPQTSTKIAAVLAEKDVAFLDVPMTRTPKEAEEGRLNLLVGGEERALLRVRPVLEAFSENITHTGGVGSGHAMKLLHNFVSLSQIGVIAEAAACADKAGVSADVFVQVLREGGGGGVALERMAQMVESGDPSALRFSLSNAAKDIGYYRAMAENLRANRSLADGIAENLEAAINEMGGESFVPLLAKL